MPSNSNTFRLRKEQIHDLGYVKSQEQVAVYKSQQYILMVMKPSRPFTKQQLSTNFIAFSLSKIS
jgi:hypothetical protein